MSRWQGFGSECSILSTQAEESSLSDLSWESKMAGGWYYAHDDDKLGPFSGEQLKEFAASGVILPTDTVWKGGVEAGVLASRIKNLFSPAAANAGLAEAKAPPVADVPVPAPPD